MMFINLDRRFCDLAEDDLEDIDFYLSLDGNSFVSGVGWQELLDCARVILLAEAGAGKTREMKEQAERLARTGKPAFFAPLEDLDRGPFPDLLCREKERRFETWKTDGAEPAWFFLDAVDELKLTQGKLDRALRRFSKDIDGHLSRARIFISCRSSDWRPEIDLATVRERLPIPEKNANVSVRSPEETFLEALAPPSLPGDHHKAAAAQKAPESVRTVAMFPMSDVMIKRFAHESDVQDAAAFLKEIERQNAWMFARRPMDLITLAESWTNSRLLGTLERQHEANVETKLKDDTDRPGSDVLCDIQAQEGAESLALGLALTRTRTIRSPEQALDTDRADGVLDAAKVLPRWTEAQRRSLLRRALFDPATYGRVCFHHRSAQEYLAARCLRRLREQGMPIKKLFRLLFAERYGLHVVLPSMRAIAAWLALWEPRVKKELLEREPEALVSVGDPGSLDLPIRGTVVHAFVSKYGRGKVEHVFVDKYGRGDERGLNLGEVRRLAHPDLAPVIRRCWGREPANEDVLSLLLALIRFGPTVACADLAAAAARKTTWAPYHRRMAIHALVACDRRSDLRSIVDAMLEQPEAWPDEIVNGVLAELFPKFIGAERVLALMERANESQRGSIDFTRQLQRIVEAADPPSDAIISLRDGMAELIWRARAPGRSLSDIGTEFEHLAEPLAAICDQQLSRPAPDPALIRACVIASRFGGRLLVLREAVQRLRRRFRETPGLRPGAFWAELKLMDEAFPVDDDRLRWEHAAYDGLIGSLDATDRSWLLKALADRNQASRRPVALWALLDIWRRHGRSPDDRRDIRDILEGDPSLESVMEEFGAPPEPGEGIRDDGLERMVQESGKAEAQRLERWKNWRERLVAEPDEAFSPERMRQTLFDLHEWLKKAGGQQHRVWDKDALSGAFSADIADRAELALRRLWRTVRPLLQSERPPAARNRTIVFPEEWVLGLMGVSAEAASPRWTEALSPEEARRAATYATIELNGFAPFIDDLARSRPEVVEEVIGSEIGAELRLGHEYDRLPTLNGLIFSHAEHAELRTLLAPRLAAELAPWPAGFLDTDNPRWMKHLDTVLEFLYRSDADRAQIARLCGERFRDNPEGALALVWLRGLVRSDPAQGAQVLIESVTNGDIAAYDPVETFARMYGSFKAIHTDITDPSERVDVLEPLLRCIYAIIRPEDDSSELHSPRKAAQRAREYLLNLLLCTPGPEARRAVRRFANEAEFADERDCMLLLNRDQAALDAEFLPFAPEDVAALQERFEAPPRDRDGLFAVMLNRLDDLAHDIMHGDFSDRETLRKIDAEPEMQHTLAMRLDLMANDFYRVTREEEVADKKRADIRLVTEGHKAAIEVKIADHLTLKELEQALCGQLLGRYMRHRDCKAGCLLLTYHGRKSRWKAAGKRKRLEFKDVIEFLAKRAEAIECEHDVRVAVFGLDLVSAQAVAVNSQT